MITTLDLFPLLKNELPGLGNDLCSLKDVKSPYELTRLFITYALSNFENKQHRTTEKCLTLAEFILEEADLPVRRAVELIFIPAFAEAINSGKIQEARVPDLLLERCKSYSAVLSRL